MAGPAPTARTAAATAAVVRRGDETAAARLREHGWVVVAPEILGQVQPALRRQLDELAERS